MIGWIFLGLGLVTGALAIAELVVIPQGDYIVSKVKAITT